MARNVSIQTYLPMHVAAWVHDEATRAKQSRSQWIGAIVTDLFQGQELREETIKIGRCTLVTIDALKALLANARATNHKGDR